MNPKLAGRIDALGRDAWKITRNHSLFSDTREEKSPFDTLDNWVGEIKGQALSSARLPMLQYLPDAVLIDELRALAAKPFHYEKEYHSSDKFRHNVAESFSDMLVTLGLQNISDIVDVTRIKSTLGVAPPVALVLNPFQGAHKNLLETICELTEITPQSVRWTNHGFRLHKPIDNTALSQNDRAQLIHKLFDGGTIGTGSIYIKDTAHMLPPALLLGNIAQVKKPFVLDMCAAPGGKTLQLAILMNKRGTLIANNPSGPRNTRLTQTLNSFAVDAKITNVDGAWFGDNMQGQFHAVLCDVPCSGSGDMRRNPLALVQYSPNLTPPLQSLQRKLLYAAIQAAKPNGGRVVLSTCSVYPEENESLVQWALSKFKGTIRVVDPRHAIDIDSASPWSLDNAIEDSRVVQSVRLGLSEDNLFPMVRIWPDLYTSDAGCCAIFERCE